MRVGVVLLYVDVRFKPALYIPRMLQEEKNKE